MDLNLGSSPGKLADCRICHDEDEDSNMEIPCSCRGSLKQFKPGYTAPTPLFHYGGAPMNFRGNWAISRSDMHDSELAEMVSTEENFLDSNFDEYPIPTSRGLICCRIVAVILMVLLVLRHTLPFIIYGAGESSISLFTLLMLRMVGILLPIYIMVKALTAIQRRQNQQNIVPEKLLELICLAILLFFFRLRSPILPLPSPDEENGLPQHQQTTAAFTSHSHSIIA